MTARLGRRSLVIGGAAAGVGLLLLLQDHFSPMDLPGKLLRAAGREAGLRAPEVTGEPGERLTGQLWLLFTRLSARWGMTGAVDLDEPAFAGIIREKTARAPSYLTEYREAGALLDEVGPDLQRDAAALDPLIGVPGGRALLDPARLGRFQVWVVGEFLELQLAFGGFRAFGYANYRGFAGGPLSDPARAPYRSL